MTIEWSRERRNLSDLVPWEDNPRYITKTDAARLGESLDDFGQIQAIAIGPDNDILDGHQRTKVWAALDRYGADYEVDVRVASRQLSEGERRKLAAMLHTGAVGSWDWDALAAWDFEELQGWGFNTDTLTEWNDDAANLSLMLEAEEEEPPDDAEPQVDKAEELRELWGVELGQMWRLGEHRIICGDCTDADVVDRVMDGEKAALCATDPPYNVGKDYGDKTDDEKQAQVYENFSRLWFDVAQGNSDRQMLTPGGINHIEWARWFESKHCGVWIKTNALTRGRVSNSWCWEPVFFYGEHWPKGRANDVFNYPIGQQAHVGGHPCPKPLTLIEDFVENYTSAMDTVLDPFLGSGTTLIACERLGRKCRAVEISPGYVAVAIQRWVDVTGGEPELYSE